MARVKKLTLEEGQKLDISRFPNFHKSGSIRGMKKLYYGVMPCWLSAAIISIIVPQNQKFTIRRDNYKYHYMLSLNR